MARTDAERLEVLKTQRDEIDDQLSTPEYRIGTRATERRYLVQNLQAIKQEILDLESKIARTSGGSARNYADLRRNP